MFLPFSLEFYSLFVLSVPIFDFTHVYIMTFIYLSSRLHLALNDIVFTSFSIQLIIPKWS